MTTAGTPAIPNGMGGFLDFATGLGKGKFKIATGILTGPQGVDAKAYVTDRNGGEVLRFRIEADETGTFEVSVPDPEFPVGITTTASSIIATPAGANVPVANSNLLLSVIENVPISGSTSATAYIFEDPRESEVATPPNQPLHRSLPLKEISTALQPDIVIPAYVRAFPKDNPVTGTPTFILLVVDTNAEILGIVSHVLDESLALGYEPDPDCDEPDITQQTRLFWTPSEGEPSIQESPRFIDMTNGCGTSKGFTRHMSLFLGGRDTRAADVVAQAKLDGLSQVMADSQCVSAKVRKSMERKLKSAIRQFDRGRIAKAIADLQGFVAIAETSPGAFLGCSNNEGGGLRARAQTAIFSLTKLL